eukprot:105265_1
MSKYLIETVNCFGSHGNTKCGSWNSKGELGPFFTGMNVVMCVPSFRIRLCGPTSTTKEILVAQNFSKNTGIILEFDNQSDYSTKKLRFFNVSWLSKYSEESERIFIHGQWPLEISSIRLTKNWDNFGSFFKPLSQFDAAISGGQPSAVRGFNDLNAEMLNLLFKNDENIPEYIKNTWKMYRFHKKTIHLDYADVIEYEDGYPRCLQNLLLESVFKGGIEDENNLYYCEFSDNRNLLRREIVDLFPNLTEIVLECTCYHGYDSYQFSLFGL